jgi:hypothetical protein
MYELDKISSRAPAIVNSAMKIMNGGLDLRASVTQFESRINQVRRGESPLLSPNEVTAFRGRLQLDAAPAFSQTGLTEWNRLQVALGELRRELEAPMDETGLVQSAPSETFARLETRCGSLRECIAILIGTALEDLRADLLRVQNDSDRTLHWIMVGWCVLFGVIASGIAVRCVVSLLRSMGVWEEGSVSR